MKFGENGSSDDLTRLEKRLNDCVSSLVYFFITFSGSHKVIYTHFPRKFQNFQHPLMIILLRLLSKDILATVFRFEPKYEDNGVVL